MNARYFLWQLRRWLGFGIVYLSLALGVSVLVPFLIRPEEGGAAAVFSTASLIPLYFGSAFAVLMAGLTFSYRYSRRSSDYFLSLPTPALGFRLARMLVSLIYVLVPYVVSFFLTTAVVALRFGPIDAGLVFGTFGYAFAMLVATYLLFLFPFARAKTVFEALFLLVLVISILSLDLVPYGLYTLLSPMGGTYDPTNTASWEVLLSSALFPMGIAYPSLSYGVFILPLLGGASLEEIPPLLGQIITAKTIVYPLLALASGATALFLKEPSGEKMGTSSKGPLMERYLLHYVMAELALMLGSSALIFTYLPIIPVILIIIYLVFYYGVVSLYNHSFIPTLADLPGYGASLLFFAVGIITCAIAMYA